MCSEITPTQYNAFGQQTPIQHNWYAFIIPDTCAESFVLQGEIKHKLAKCWFECTNKSNFIPQLAIQDAQAAFLHNIGADILKASQEEQKSQHPHKASKKSDSGDPLSEISDKYHMAEDRCDSIALNKWLTEQPGISIPVCLISL